MDYAPIESYYEGYTKSDENLLMKTGPLTELEMIRAAKLILANSNPKFYSRETSLTLTKENSMAANFKDFVEAQKASQNKENTPRNDITQVTKSHKGIPDSDPWHTRLLKNEEEERIEKELIDRLVSKMQSQQNLDAETKQRKKVNQEKYFTENFLSEVTQNFQNNPKLVFLRVLADEENIDGRKMDQNVYSCFDFFNVKGNSQQFAHQPNATHGNAFFLQNYYEENRVDRNQDMEFVVNGMVGNLWKVNKIGLHRYELVLQKETNSHEYSFNFNFGIEFKGLQEFECHFTIKNFNKNLIERTKELRICSRVNEGNWKRNIYCQKNGTTISFSFKKHSDTMSAQFALIFPFNLTIELRKLIQEFKLSKAEQKNKKIKATLFEYGKSLLKQTLYYYRLKEIDKTHVKPALILTAGLKPVNNLSSNFVLQFIREILTESEEACILAKTFDIYIFLEMNPDGKLLGNTYKSACGIDLSTLSSYSKTLHPELFFFHKAIREIDIKHKISIFIDFNDNWNKLDNKTRTLCRRTRAER